MDKYQTDKWMLQHIHVSVQYQVLSERGRAGDMYRYMYICNGASHAVRVQLDDALMHGDTPPIKEMRM